MFSEKEERIIKALTKQDKQKVQINTIALMMIQDFYYTIFIEKGKHNNGNL